MAAAGEWSDSRVRTRSGQTIHASAAVVLLSDNTRISLVQDVTDRRRAEGALRESERKLAEAGRVAHVGWWALDLDAGRFTWSDETARILGRGAHDDDWTFDRARALHHPDDVAAYDAAVARVRQGESGFAIDYRIVRPDGEVRHLNNVIAENTGGPGRPRRAFGVAQDVTEWKRATAALAESRARLQEKLQLLDTLMDSLPGIVRLFGGDGRFLRWNRVLEQVTGYSGEELARLTPVELTAPEDRPAVSETIRAVLSTGQDAAELHLLARDGRAIPYFFKGVRLDTGQGAVRA